ncbi:anti-sigma-F factor Fin [Aureibacillus halotolerans]|uniref:Uncharacterized protein DUF2757 n=1 Tax=Aureibacillus halotolerans TaxID=1508390 RepID=A0A4R6TUP5_9BACI|nr:anti-sigma-F factor Fin [Aureibacillus halotolerans]TDQ34226.1 uncharacterized protein DUF2757 [Aureibacillus halotolerans]
MFVYRCRHCGVEVGRLPKTDHIKRRLGFTELSVEEQHTMLQDGPAGETYVQCICESCQEALAVSPEFHQLERFIQ